MQHHVHTNDIHLDPDMTSDPGPLRQVFFFASSSNCGIKCEINYLIHFCRMNPLAPLMKLQLFQHIYFFFLLALYGFSVVVTAIGE